MSVRTLAVLALLASVHSAKAMDYSIGMTDESRFIYAKGSIEEGEARRFLRFLGAQEQWTGKTFLALDSPGGMVADALAIALLVERAKFMTSIGPGGRCASACVLIWAAGSRKFVTADGCVGVHNAFTVDDKVTARWTAATRQNVASQANGMMARWLKDHGAPANVTIKLLNTPSTNMYCLTPEDLAAWSVKIVVVP